MKLEKFGRGTNGTKVVLGDVDIYFSYTTPIAFDSPATGLVVRQNDWNVTTGGHLNAIDNGNKTARISGVDFVAQLEKVGAGLANVLADLG